MGKTDVGPTAVADCGPMKMPMEARHRADEFCQLGRTPQILKSSYVKRDQTVQTETEFPRLRLRSNSARETSLGFEILTAAEKQLFSGSSEYFFHLSRSIVTLIEGQRKTAERERICRPTGPTFWWFNSGTLKVHILQGRIQTQLGLMLQQCRCVD